MPAKASEGRGRRDPLLLSSLCGSPSVSHSISVDVIPLAPSHPTWVLGSGSRSGVVLRLGYSAARKLEDDRGEW